MNDQEPKFLQGKRGEYLVVLQFVIFFSFILMPVWNPLATPDLLADLRTLRWVVLVIFWTCALLLGGFGLIHIRDYLTPLPYPVDHNQLVQHGVYGIVRHPLYSSQLFAGFGWAVFNLSLSHFALLTVGFFFFHYKASREEHWLQARHPHYTDYARRVKKFIPWLY